MSGKNVGNTWIQAFWLQNCSQWDATVFEKSGFISKETTEASFIHLTNQERGNVGWVKRREAYKGPDGTLFEPGRPQNVLKVLRD